MNFWSNQMQVNRTDNVVTSSSSFVTNERQYVRSFKNYIGYSIISFGLNEEKITILTGVLFKNWERVINFDLNSDRLREKADCNGEEISIRLEKEEGLVRFIINEPFYDDDIWSIMTSYEYEKITY